MDTKAYRILNMLNRLINGERITKAEEAKHFGVNGKTIQRDIEEIRAYLKRDEKDGRKLIYSKLDKEYYIIGKKPRRKKEPKVSKIKVLIFLMVCCRNMLDCLGLAVYKMINDKITKNDAIGIRCNLF